MARGGYAICTGCLPNPDLGINSVFAAVNLNTKQLGLIGAKVAHFLPSIGKIGTLGFPSVIPLRTATLRASSFNFSQNTEGEIADTVFWEGVIPPAGTIMTVVTEINPTQSTSREYANMAVCFAACTGLQTQVGEKRVGDLQVGDFVMAFDGHKATAIA